jgi:hypothetical protein
MPPGAHLSLSGHLHFILIKGAVPSFLAVGTFRGQQLAWTAAMAAFDVGACLIDPSMCLLTLIIMHLSHVHVTLNLC